MKRKSSLFSILFFVTIAMLTGSCSNLFNKASDADESFVDTDKSTLSITYASGDSAASVTQDITLPTSLGTGTKVVWASSNASVLSSTGTVTRPVFDVDDPKTTVTLTATIANGTATTTETFTVVVMPQDPTDAEAVASDKEALAIGYATGDSATSVTQDVTLATSGTWGTTISWSSSASSNVAADGDVNRPTLAEGDQTVTLTATISKNGESATKTFELKVTKFNGIYFDANSGTGTMTAQTVTKGESVTLTSNTFTKTGYSFAGWAASSDGSVAYADGGTYAMTSDTPVTLYAKWTVNSYHVSFDSNGGSGSMTELAADYGSTVALTANAFTRSGYTFSGWAASAGGSAVYYDGADYTLTTAGDVTLYAVWLGNSHTITFDANGGSGTMSTESVWYNSSVTLSTNAFTRSKYVFSGWATNAGGSVVYTNGGSYTLSTDADVTLYAVWKLCGVASVVYQNNGSAVNCQETGDAIVITFNSAVLPSSINASLTAGGSITLGIGGISFSITTTSFSMSENALTSWNIGTFAATGTISTQTSYIGCPSASTIALDSTATVLTITLFNGNGAAFKSFSSSNYITFTPSSSILTSDGSALDATSYSTTSGSMF